MEIKKIKEFINESIGDTLESYINDCLLKLKKKIESYFSEEQTDLEKANFSELGLVLEKIELITRPNLRLSVRYSDDVAFYQLYVEIKITDVRDLAKKNPTEFDDTKINLCYIKFKKYDSVTSDIIGQVTETISPNDIDQEYLVELKVKLDDEFNETEDDFEIEF